MTVVETAVKICSRAKLAMEHSTVLSRMIPTLRRCGLDHIVHAMRNYTQTRDWTAEDAEEMRAYFADHKAEFDRLSAMLEDDFSRKTLQAVMKFRISKKMSVLKGYSVYPQYFQKDVFGPVENEVFVDGGAYTGDTVESYLRNFALAGGG